MSALTGGTTPQPPTGGAGATSRARGPGRGTKGTATPSPDTRLVPVATGVWVGTWLGTADTVSALAWCTCLTALVVAALAAGRRSRWLLVAVLMAACCGLGLGWLRHQAVAGSQVATWSRDRATVVVEGRVSDDPDFRPAAGTRPALARFTLAVRSARGRGVEVHQRGSAAVSASGGAAERVRSLQVGETVSLTGQLVTRRDHQPELAELRVRQSPRTLRPAGVLDGAVNHVRASLREAMRWSPADQQQLVPSFVVGDRTDVSDATATRFKATGLTHLMAVSGTNLALALAFVLAVARAVGVPRIGVRTLALATVVGFVVVCRGEPSVLRAAAMGLVTLASAGPTSAGRRGVRHLSAATVVLLLVDPWLAASVGFQLSVAATGGIIWWGQGWQKALAQHCPGWLAETIAVPLAAQVATQPVVTQISGGISAVGMLANALAAPFVGPTTVVGLVAMGLQLAVPALGAAAGWVAGWCAAPVIVIAARLAALPGAVWPWPASPLSLVLLAAACVVTAWVVPHLLAWRWGWCVVVLVCLVGPFVRPVQVGWPGNWQVVFCDVGQGDSTVIRAGDHSAVVVDVGPETSAARDCLHHLGVSDVPLVLLTHFHADHTGGLEAVEDAVHVGQVVLNPLRSPAADVTRVEQVVMRHQTPVRTASVGDAFTVGDARVQVIDGGPLPGLAVDATEGESPAENDSSLVLRIQVGELTTLVAGDAEPLEQQAVLSHGVDLRAQVLKMPHHGSARQDDAFWQATGAVEAVASAGLHNDYGHPAPAALRLASRCGMRVDRTDLEGSIAVSLRAGSLVVRTQRAPP